MRLFASLSAAVILAALAFVACNSKDGSGSAARTSNSSSSSTGSASGPTASTPSDGVRRITTAELHDALEKGTAVVVDVRSAESYRMSHIKGALNIPEGEIVSRKNELPRDKTIALYCS
ncbi:MAG: rhodanese-like domain-containing protein [Acidobacteria bacterium]|nr:rhodanese-like domain-containing protein [Acidobacteriota bacterium]